MKSDLIIHKTESLYNDLNGMISHVSLVRLNFLEMSNSHLNVLPNTLGKLVQLTSLVLKGNKLTSLPESLNSLTKVRPQLLPQ